MCATRRSVRVCALALLAMVPLAAPAFADPGDLSGAGCLRDLKNTAAGCPSAQGLDRGYGVAVSGDGRQTYVASADDDTLTTFARDPQTGALTWVGCLRDGGSPLTVARASRD